MFALPHFIEGKLLYVYFQLFCCGLKYVHLVRIQIGDASPPKKKQEEELKNHETKKLC